jgi:hypothetical protein
LNCKKSIFFSANAQVRPIIEGAFFQTALKKVNHKFGEFIMPTNYDPRAFPNNRVVMRPSEKSEVKAAGQKGSEAWFLHVENVCGRQRRHRALQPAAIERVIGIGSFMQNKPNLLDAQMNLSSVLTKYYENKRLCRCGQNKPNQTRSEFISKGAKLLTGELLAILKPGTNQTQSTRICATGQQKPTQKRPISSNFYSKSAHFCKFLTTFYAFSPIFDQIFLAHFTQTTQPNSAAPIFRSKTMFAPKSPEIISQKPNFLKIRIIPVLYFANLTGKSRDAAIYDDVELPNFICVDQRSKFSSDP